MSATGGTVIEIAWVARLKAATCLAALLGLAPPLSQAQAADIKVLTFSSSRPILTEAGPVFERASGHTLTIVYGSIEPQRDQIAQGEVADVVITSRVLADDLNKRGKIADHGIIDLARITIRLFVRAGATKPDIATVEALKRSLLAAEKVAFTNPARGALAGRSFADALKRMGIYDQVLARANVIPGLGHDVVAAVVRGEATIGAGPANDVTPLPTGIDIVGPRPKELESDTMISAALLAAAPVPDAAAAFIAFLRSPTGAAAMIRQGLEP
jgi:molybdate transport system substrate-binding protein